MKRQFNKLYLVTIFVLSISFSCNKRPFIADYANTGGYVIGREVCNSNEMEDYWLVDLTYYNNTPQYGDTLILNGVTYTNVVKVKKLDQRLKAIGTKVSFDFKTITPNKVVTTGCNVTSPVTYDLKELFIINQGEIR